MPGSIAPQASTSSFVIMADGGHYLWDNRRFYVRTIKDGHVLVTGKRWNLKSAVETSVFGNSAPDRPMMRVEMGDSRSNWVERPRTEAVGELANACLDLVRQEEEDREHQAAVEKAEREAAARIEAQKDADEKAESQARIATQELTALQESKRRVAATELLRTQTLETQIQHEEVVASILREIIRIRLAGQEDRARITNQYMTRAEATAASFEEETVETESRIQAYLDFNAALLTRLEEYQADIGARLQRIKTSIAEQQASIDRLELEAQELIARDDEEGSTPEPDQPTP